MPSFSQEQIRAWHDEHVVTALRERKPTESQWALLEADALEVESRVASLKSRLSSARAVLSALRKKLARRGLR